MIGIMIDMLPSGERDALSVASLSPELLKQVDEALARARVPGTEEYARFQEIGRRIHARIQPVLDSVAKSEDITREDLSIMVY
jgi:hypothetical protein